MREIVFESGLTTTSKDPSGVIAIAELERFSGKSNSGGKGDNSQDDREIKHTTVRRRDRLFLIIQASRAFTGGKPPHHAE
jgi:hypothetical protein